VDGLIRDRSRWCFCRFRHSRAHLSYQLDESPSDLIDHAR
jgi:hypothetical protein